MEKLPLAESIGDAGGKDGRGEAVEIGPVLVLHVDGAEERVVVGDVVDAAAERVGKEASDERTLVVLGLLGHQITHADESLCVKLEAAVGIDEARADEVAVLGEVGGRDDVDEMDIALDADVWA